MLRVNTENMRAGCSLLFAVSAVLGLPSCWRMDRIPQHVFVAVYRDSFNEKKPQYELYLRGAFPNAVQFKQLSFRVRNTRAAAAQYDVFGTGAIAWRSNTIQVNDGLVRVNGKQLPTPEFRGFVIDENGRFVNGFIRTFD